MLSQPNLINKLIKNFKSKIANLCNFETPAVGGSRVQRPTTKEELISDNQQTEFRSGVGSLLYLLKHSRPDLSNSVRELTKVMDGANAAHQKMLYRTIKYVQQTKNRKLMLLPWKNGLHWDLKAYTDSNYARDADTQKGVSGYLIYINGCLVAWRSKGQKSVTLSSTKAEYVGISEVAMEILFIAGVMKFCGMEVTYLIEINVDNIGAIYLSKNATTGNWTKHVDICYHFVQEYVEDGTLKIVFVQSEDNTTDLMMKNLGNEFYAKHTKGMFDMDQN